METHKNFLEFNGKNIIFINEDGTYYVAIKPICEALNIDYTAQLKRVKNHQILGAAYVKRTMQVPISTVKNRPAFQGREMGCLPEKYVYGWIFSINSDSPDLIKYQENCYSLLYDHFHGAITGRKELLVERRMVETEIFELKEQLKENDATYQALKKLETKKKSISTKLNAIDNSVVNQTAMNLN